MPVNKKGWRSLRSLNFTINHGGPRRFNQSRFDSEILHDSPQQDCGFQDPDSLSANRGLGQEWFEIVDEIVNVRIDVPANSIHIGSGQGCRLPFDLLRMLHQRFFRDFGEKFAADTTPWEHLQYVRAVSFYDYQASPVGGFVPFGAR